MEISAVVTIYLPDGRIKNADIGEMVTGSVISDIRETDNGVIIIFEDGETHVFGGMPYILKTAVDYD